MTPKEEAEELVDIYRVIIPPLDKDKWKSFEAAKKCALITVDRIIKAIDALQYNRKTDHWERVKEEIKKL